MIQVLSVENMRKSDAFTIAKQVPSKELMLRAGRGIFKTAKWKEPVAVVCGSGNNAGDGFVTAGLLNEAGISCVIFLLSGKTSEDGKYYLSLCREAGIPVKMWQHGTSLTGFSTILDCIFGTGFRGEVHGPAREAIEAINCSGAYVISADINSGLNGDSGMAELCVHSDLTISIGGWKTGHFLNMAKDVIRDKRNCDIGILPVDRTYGLLEACDLVKMFRPRANFSNKGSYGYIALIGGSVRYSGAIRLAEMANAAMRSGAGVVKTAVPNTIRTEVASTVMESTIFPLSDDKKGIIFNEEEISELVTHLKTTAFGMGIGTGEGAAQTLDYLLRNFQGILIVDADGLTLLSRLDKERIRNASCSLILTPHIKEFSRLTGLDTEEILNHPVATAEAYAAENQVILLLKGPTTIITDGKTTYLTDTGCAGMATAGSGDVLSGILSAVTAYSGDPLLGTAAAAWINGKAGELAQSHKGSISMTAGDTVACIPEIIFALEKANR